MQHWASSTADKVNALCEMGQHLVSQQSWQEAAASFERALAYIPNFLGVQPWCQRYFLDGQTPINHSPDFVAAIYAELSICRHHMGRIADSSQLADAALRLAPGCRKAQYIKAIGSKRANAQSSGDNHSALAMPTRMVANDSGIDQISILMFTNYTEKLRHHPKIAPPSTNLVKAIFGSVIHNFGDQVIRCKKWLCYDRPFQDTSLSRRYEAALSTFARDFGFHFRRFGHEGLQQVYRQIIAHVNTPYLLFLEHDQLFTHAAVDLLGLLALLNRHPEINHVRFNKRPNIISNFDYLLSNNNQTLNYFPLLKTTAYSNGPHILRVAKFKNHWLRMCIEDPISKTMPLQGTAIGIEEPLFKRYMIDVRQTGFEQAHSHWGTYLYGGYHFPAKIVHLGE
jgi:tetratricopeptide (TPR) repeat protein